jgi:pimeloyl-ACP methyl ester carboxylesterase
MDDAGLVVTAIAGPEAAPPLVVLPGLPGGKSGGMRLLRRLAAERTVLCVEPLGSGGAEVPPPGPGYAWPAQVERLLAVLDARGLAEVDVLGWSLGGVWAQHALLAAPRRFRRAVLAVTAAKLRARERALIDHLQAVFAARWSGEGITRGLLPLLFAPDFLHRPGAMALLAAHFEQSTFIHDGWVGQLAALAGHALERELAAATAICRVIVAELDWLFPPSEGERLAGFAGAPLERIAGAGHAVWVECDEALARITLAALATGR